MWYVTIGVLLAETTFYLIFASGEVQKWNNVHENDGDLKKTDDLMDNQYHKNQMETKKKAV